jgi:transposase InsO family protein
MRAFPSPVASIDFFTVPTVRHRVLFVFVVLAHLRRRVPHLAITEHPTTESTARQITEAFPEDSAPRDVIRDRDSIYGDVFRGRTKAIGIREVLIAPRSPWQNPYVERLIGSIRRELLDHVIVERATSAAPSPRVPRLLPRGEEAPLAGEGRSHPEDRAAAVDGQGRLDPGARRPSSPVRAPGGLTARGRTRASRPARRQTRRGGGAPSARRSGPAAPPSPRPTTVAAAIAVADMPAPPLMTRSMTHGSSFW